MFVDALAPARELDPVELVSPSARSQNLNRTVVSDDMGDLARLFESSVAVCVALRPASAELTAHVASTFDRLAESKHRVDTTEDLPPPSMLGGGDGGALLRDDIAFLAELCRDLSGCETVGLRLGVSTRPLCPGFHVDRILFRLVCTYLGPGTEWCDHRGDLPAVLRAPSFAVVALKGDAWPGNEGRGARHRSPGHDTPRMMVSVEPL